MTPATQTSSQHTNKRNIMNIQASRAATICYMLGLCIYYVVSGDSDGKHSWTTESLRLCVISCQCDVWSVITEGIQRASEQASNTHVMRIEEMYRVCAITSGTNLSISILRLASTVWFRHSLIFIKRFHFLQFVVVYVWRRAIIMSVVWS